MALEQLEEGTSDHLEVNLLPSTLTWLMERADALGCFPDTITVVKANNVFSRLCY